MKKIFLLAALGIYINSYTVRSEGQVATRIGIAQSQYNINDPIYGLAGVDPLDPIQPPVIKNYSFTRVIDSLKAYFLQKGDTGTMLSPYLRTVQAAALYYPLSNPNGYISSVPAQTWASITGKPSFATVATSGDYNDLSNKPTIPTNNNQLTNGAGYITGINSSTVTTALGFTPYNSTNPNSYINQAGARSAISLTTTGSGAATYNSTTGVLNVPTPSAGGTVTSVSLSMPSGFNVSGSPVTSSGGFTVTGAGTASQFINGAGAVSNFPATTNAAGYGSGSTYNLTTSSAKIDFGTTDPTVTLGSAGTYLITSNVTIDYTGLTTLSVAAANFKLRRTNNTASDLANSSTNFNVPIVTLLTQTGGDVDLPQIIYTTSNSGDVIEIWGNRGAISLGAITVSGAWVTAVKLY